jgi:hypothetical protein
MAAAAKIQPLITPADWIRGNLLLPVFGITSEAARKYRERGIWLEGLHFRKDPVGQYVYSRPAITNWMGGKP